MLKNYFIIAWRNLLAHRLFSAINVLGLAIGLASSVLIMLFIRYELSYDRHYEDSDRIVRVVRHFWTGSLSLAAIAPPFSPLLKDEFEEVEDATRIWTAQLAVTQGDRAVDSVVGMADPNVFDFFGLEFTQGEAAGALDEPMTVVLSRSAADQLFGNQDALGKTINVLGQLDLKVTGVIEDLPQNTHLSFDMLASLSTMFMVFEGEEQSYGSNNYYTYLRLPPGYDPQELAGKLPAFLQKHLGEDANDWTGLEIQRLEDIHLHSALDSEMKANGSIDVVMIFTAIALVILLIACINFMNLTTARSTQRAREVGMRKVAGATHGQLIFQFLGESILLTAAAMVIAIALVELFLPWFGSFVERDLTFDYLANPGDLLALVGLTLLVGVIAGSYPAFHLAAFRPAEVLKGAVASAPGSITVRKVLVVIQFAISITLMIATGVVMAQLNYTQTRDMGYEREHNLIVGLPFQVDGSTYRQYPPLRDRLRDSAAIQSVTISSRVPTGQLLDGSGYRLANPPKPDITDAPLRDLRVGFGFFEHYAITMVAGRSPGERFGDRLMTPREDPKAGQVIEGQIVLNETAVRTLGYDRPEDAIGELLVSGGEEGPRLEWTIVGVAADFNFTSLHETVRPVAFTLAGNHLSQVSIKSVAGRIDEAYAAVEAALRELFPGQSVGISFLDDRFDGMYRQERRQGLVFAIFAGLAIFVAALGLFGLASFTTERRTKEIGIRKVMGASVRDIVLLLTREFSVLVLIANLIAWPVAWYFMSDWLTRFAYHIDLSALVFAMAALAAFVIAWATVAAQAGKAALRRPVLALRYE